MGKNKIPDSPLVCYLVKPDEFIKGFCKDFEPEDHHYTGPIIAQMSPDGGTVSDTEGRILATLARKLGGPVLEIGAALGVSTRYIHEGMERYATEPGLGRMFCVGTTLDRPPNALTIFSVDIFSKWPDDPDWPYRVRIKADSKEFFPDLKCKWAFIDGDHSFDGVCTDIDTAIRAGCKHLIFHDTDPTKQKPTSEPFGQDGTEARRAVLTKLKLSNNGRTWTIFDIPTECGMIYATCTDWTKHGNPLQK
jgi:hypothetical protein